MVPVVVDGIPLPYKKQLASEVIGSGSLWAVWLPKVEVEIKWHLRSKAVGIISNSTHSRSGQGQQEE